MTVETVVVWHGGMLDALRHGGFTKGELIVAYERGSSFYSIPHAHVSQDPDDRDEWYRPSRASAIARARRL